MLTVKEIQNCLHDRKLTVVAQETGLSYNTVRAIANGMNPNPDYKTVMALSKYLEGNDE